MNGWRSPPQKIQNQNLLTALPDLAEVMLMGIGSDMRPMSLYLNLSMSIVTLYGNPYDIMVDVRSAGLFISFSNWIVNYAVLIFRNALHWNLPVWALP